MSPSTAVAMSAAVTVSPAVAAALASHQPVVALESTVYSTLGLPAPHNKRVLESSHQVITNGGATPALTAVIDGRPVVGLDDPTPVLTATAKVAARDLAVAMAKRWSVGVTTVGASLTLAHHAGVDVFATGGIGGVHRNAAVTGDISGDLPVIGRYPIVTVCAGAKAFLDLPRTLEMLETLGVVVIGFGTDELPAFTTTTSGLPVPHRMDDPAEIADVLRCRKALGQGGVLVCVPPPEPLDAEVLDAANEQAEAAADAAAITGSARTPYILGAIADLTNGASVSANTALVANNATIATAIAVALAAG
ncbi:MAG: pseudouridine-5'-phosphate glycosidase [Acidimicrobiales bacterium]|jgi:pseudouridine-5'-phosphate glycosidase